jgi:hypothetical protein
MRTFTWSCLAAFVLSSSPAAADLKTPEAPAPTPATTAREELAYLHNPDGVIVPARLVSHFRFDEDPHFTPTRDQVHALEAALPAYLRKVARTKEGREYIFITPEFLRALPHHKRQYFGFDDKPHRCILLDATCSNEDDWRHHGLEFLDGGPCYWHVTYDVVSRTFSNLWFD